MSIVKTYPISVISKETGLTKYLLRMWERRYPYPRPIKNAADERVYTQEDMDKLMLISQLLKIGYRPSMVMMKSLEELRDLVDGRPLQNSKHDLETMRLQSLIAQAREWIKDITPTSLAAEKWMNETMDINGCEK